MNFSYVKKCISFIKLLIYNLNLILKHFSINNALKNKNKIDNIGEP